MPAHSVELLLDEASEALVRDQWARLADAGLPSLAGHAGPTNAPHVTLAAFASAPGQAAESALAGAVRDLPLTARLGAPMLFGHSRLVLVRAVVPTADLLALQASTYAVAATVPSLLDHFAPGHWTPHLTLAHGLRAGQVGEALAALGAGGDPVTFDDAVTFDDQVTFTAARRWDPDAQRVWTL